MAESRDVDVGFSAKALVLLLLVVAAALAGVAWLVGGPPPPPPAAALPVERMDEAAALTREKAPKLGHVDEAMRRLEKLGWPEEAP